MGKIIFQISYEIRTDKRPDFTTIANKLRSELRGLGLNYGIYEVQGQENAFNEIFICETQEEFDELEDRTNDTISVLVDKLARCLNGKMKYTTLREF